MTAPEKVTLTREGLYRMNLPREVRLPGYDLRDATEDMPRKWLHFGIGALAKGLILRKADDLRKLHPEWAVRGVSTQGSAKVDALKRQGKMYVVAERLKRHTEYRICAPLTKATFGPKKLERILRDLADPGVRIVTATIKPENYYQVAGLSEALLNSAHPNVAHDLLQPEEVPLTIHGYLALGLARRKELDETSTISCLSGDNLEGNGQVWRETFLQFLTKGGNLDLAEWVASHVAFPGTSVDRRVPEPSRKLRDEVSAFLGVPIEVAVETEGFSSWVVEASPFSMPPLDEVGVEVVDNILPYQERKIFFVNGGHLTALPALRAGYEHLDEALVAEDVHGRRLLDELLELYHIETARFLGDTTTPAFGKAIRDRFASQGLKDPLQRIVRETTRTKIDARLLAGIERFIEATDGKEVPRVATFLVATWLLNLGGQNEVGEPLTLNDTAAPLLREVFDGVMAWLETLLPGDHGDETDDENGGPHEEAHSGALDFESLTDEHLQPLRVALAKVEEIIGSGRYVRLAAHTMFIRMLAWSLVTIKSLSGNGGTFAAIRALLDDHNQLVAQAVRS